MLDCGAPGVEDANVWGLINLKKGDKKGRRKVLKHFNKESQVLDVVNEVEGSKKTRRVAFRGVKRQLNLWKGPVHQNRLAEQLIFPLNDNSIEFANSEKSQKIKSAAYIEDLKKETDTLSGKLYRSLYPKSLRNELSKNIDKNAQEVSKHLLEKIAMRNKERFLLAEKAAKNKRHNKIKSKNFHRHIKSRSIKEYEKEMEYLRYNKPKEFAKHILNSELNRVKERSSLRHRSGGKFAKLQKLRAKYDNEARSAVNEMHELSSQLTRKRESEELSDTDESDVDVSSESEAESNETDLDLNDDEENDSTSFPMSSWWNNKNATTKSTSDNTSSLNISTKVVEETLTKCDISSKPVLMKVAEMEVDDANHESDVLDPNSDAFFRTLQESFAADEALQRKFESEKLEVANDEALKDIDTFMPGWNAWTGPGTEEFDEKRRLAKVIKAPKVEREDSTKTHVIIKRRVNSEFKRHLVKSIPYPYNVPEQFESYISQPICREWTTESTHSQMIRPKVTVQSGRIIRPISKTAALLRDKDVERFVKQNKNV